MTHTEVDITCPCCKHEITVDYIPEEPATREEPGTPDGWEDPRGCECGSYLIGSHSRRYYEDVLLAVKTHHQGVSS
jgi:hypothetical protein